MNENREYLVLAEESGSVRISEDVITTIAYTATMETEGVADLASVNPAHDIAEFLGKKPRAKGIKVSFLEGQGCKIDLAVMIKYGCDIAAVGKAIQLNIKSALESMAQLDIKTVNVQVAGIAFGQAKGQ